MAKTVHEIRKNKELRIYINLMRRAKERCLVGYKERHHIFPKSIYGKNNSIANLTAREHYIVHKLLVRICKERYGSSDWRTNKMRSAYAAFLGKKSSPNHKFTSRQCEKMRLEKSISQSHVRHSLETKIKMSIAHKGIEFSNTHKDNISKGKIGNKNPMFGKITSKKQKEAAAFNISNYNNKRVFSDETRKKMSDAGKARQVSYETRMKLSERAKQQWIRQRREIA